MSDLIECTFLIFIHKDSILELYDILDLNECTKDFNTTIIHLLDVFFGFVRPHIPLSSDNNEILGASLLMHPECFEHNLII